MLKFYIVITAQVDYIIALSDKDNYMIHALSHIVMCCYVTCWFTTPTPNALDGLDGLLTTLPGDSFTQQFIN